MASFIIGSFFTLFAFLVFASLFTKAKQRKLWKKSIEAEELEFQNQRAFAARKGRSQGNGRHYEWDADDSEVNEVFEEMLVAEVCDLVDSADDLGETEADIRYESYSPYEFEDTGEPSPMFSREATYETYVPESEERIPTASYEAPTYREPAYEAPSYGGGSESSYDSSSSDSGGGGDD